jgi:hypothetical protein
MLRDETCGELGRIEVKIAPGVHRGDEIDKLPRVTWGRFNDMGEKMGLRGNGKQGVRIEHEAQQSCSGTADTDDKRCG